MFFYKITADVKIELSKKDRDRFREEVRRVTECSWNKRQDKLFIYDVSAEQVLFGVWTETADDGRRLTTLARELLIELNIDNIYSAELTVSETTLREGCSIIQKADYHRHEYISNDDDILKYFGDWEDRMGSVSSLVRYGNRHNIKDEYVSGQRNTPETVTRRAEELIGLPALLQELKRIYAGSRQRPKTGLPVHYFVRIDNRERQETVCRILSDALFSGGRLASGRLSFVKYRGDNDDLTNTYEICVGSTVAIMFNNYKESADDEHVTNNDAEYIEDICRAVNKHKNDTQTIICLPNSGNKLVRLFMEELPELTFVEIKEEIIYDEVARQYLRQSAQKLEIAATGALTDLVKDPRHGYTVSELDKLFDRWFGGALRKEVYPQYADFSQNSNFNNKPKGGAYKELESMTGLSAAKQIIKQAIDYHKAQKLFRDKGMPQDNPAMHMVFTGNPGTAKTTAARLLAQIMKENHILSEGRLVEVGRADLVGKYVGWTAPTVRKKFREARGSVLFIDEAYSLVDDKDGMYGDEAINTIVQEMENHREDMLVIFAGYPDKMEGFLQKNPGLRSRVAFNVPFADYSPEELYVIMEYMTASKKMRLADGVRDKLLPIFQQAVNSADFGNGRFVRNLFEQARLRQSSRLVASDVENIGEEDIRTLLAEDFALPEAPPVKPSLGFRVSA